MFYHWLDYAVSLQWQRTAVEASIRGNTQRKKGKSDLVYVDLIGVRSMATKVILMHTFLESGRETPLIKPDFLNTGISAIPNMAYYYY